MAAAATNGDARNERRLTAVEMELGQVKIGLNVLENRVVETSKDVSEFRQEWRAQKETEQRERNERAKSRQLGPVQVLQIAATVVGIFGLSMGGFFFLVKAYIDGTVTPVVTQITERQNASVSSATTRNEIMDAMRSDQVKQASLLAEIIRVATDNRTNLDTAMTRVRDLEIENARRDERQKANAEIRDMKDEAEAKMRDLADTAIRDDLSSFKSRSGG